MKKFISKVIRDGRITIPMKERKNLELNEGDLIEVQIVRKIDVRA